MEKPGFTNFYSFLISFFYPYDQQGIFITSIILQATCGLTIFLPESPYWLMSVGRRDEAQTIFIKYHGQVPGQKMEEKEEMISKKPAPISYRKLISYPETRRIILLNAYINTANTISYFGLSLNSPNLPGNLYTNVFWSAMVEIIGYVCMMLLIKRFSRRRCMIVSQLIAGIACLVLIPLIYIGTT